MNKTSPAPQALLGGGTGSGLGTSLGRELFVQQRAQNLVKAVTFLMWAAAAQAQMKNGTK